MHRTIPGHRGLSQESVEQKPWSGVLVRYNQSSLICDKYHKIIQIMWNTTPRNVRSDEGELFIGYTLLRSVVGCSPGPVLEYEAPSLTAHCTRASPGVGSKPVNKRVANTYSGECSFNRDKMLRRG